MLQRPSNYYDDLFSRLIGDGVSPPVAVERIAGAYLDGKPLLAGKRKLTKKERDSLFWSSIVVKRCLPDLWNTESWFSHWRDTWARSRSPGHAPRSVPGGALLEIVHRLFDVADALLQPFRKFALKAL